MIYFVATPIGNLKDISMRALETLNSVDIIACEDTRNSLKLLNHYNIKKKLISYHKFNEQSSSDGIIKLAEEGKDIAIISDAGMPVISDPGFVLIEKLKQAGIPYTVVPGANAGLCALLLSGFNTTRFTFIGFLPEKAKEKENLLNEIKSYKTTLIFYVSPHNLIKDIETLKTHLGTRKACLVKEITKLHESTLSFSLGDELDIEAKGEYVLIVEEMINNTSANTNASIEEQVIQLMNSGIDKNQAIKTVAKNNNMPKNEVYKLFL